ncbi:MAG: hypothetical protein AAF483_28495 [Planctomycetota bacterium]
MRNLSMRSAASRRVAALALILAATTPLFAQPGGRGNSSLPLQGKSLPQVKAFDEDGQVFSTASLKGSYTVLVFGCLT